MYRNLHIFHLFSIFEMPFVLFGNIVQWFLVDIEFRVFLLVKLLLYKGKSHNFHRYIFVDGEEKELGSWLSQRKGCGRNLNYICISISFYETRIPRINMRHRIPTVAAGIKSTCKYLQFPLGETLQSQTQ